MNFDLVKRSGVGRCGEHLVCIDLMSKGHNAFIAGEGLLYDVALDLDGSMYRIQVKTTNSYRFSPFSGKKKLVFDCRKKRYKQSRDKYKDGSFDILALVDLNTMQVGYFDVEDVNKFMTIGEGMLLHNKLENLHVIESQK